ALARESPQAAQRDLDVARVEFNVAVQVAKGSLIPDLHRAARSAAVLPDAYPLGVIAIGAERARPTGADPLRPALMSSALFLEALLQCFHQLVPAPQCFYELLVIIRMISLVFPAPPC